MSGPPLSPEVLYERLVARLRVRHLRLMAALAHHSTLADAAHEVGMTQQAGQLVASVRHTADGLAALARGQRRPLRIGAIAAAMVALLQPRLPLLRSRITDMEVQVQEGGPDAVDAGLRGGSLDLGLLRMPAVPVRAPWVWLPLLEDDIAVVASPRHPMARRKAVALADLAGLQWYLPLAHYSTHDAFVGACQAAGFTPERSPWQCISLELLPALTGDRRTVAAVPRALVATALAQGTVREIRLKDRIALPPVGALWNAQDPHPGIDTLLDLLRGAGDATPPP